MLACGEIVGAQQERLPVFELATIKPSGPDRPPLSIRQLCFRLVSRRMPTEVVVIGHVERTPAEK
jgi:hypothetical protein